MSSRTAYLFYALIVLGCITPCAICQPNRTARQERALKAFVKQYAAGIVQGTTKKQMLARFPNAILTQNTSDGTQEFLIRSSQRGQEYVRFKDEQAVATLMYARVPNLNEGERLFQQHVRKFGRPDAKTKLVNVGEFKESSAEAWTLDSGFHVRCSVCQELNASTTEVKVYFLRVVLYDE